MSTFEHAVGFGVGAVERVVGVWGGGFDGDHSGKRIRNGPVYDWIWILRGVEQKHKNRF